MKKKRKNSCQRLAKEYTYWEQRGMGVEWKVSQPPISHMFRGQTSEPSLKAHIAPPANPTNFRTNIPLPAASYPGYYKYKLLIQTMTL